MPETPKKLKYQKPRGMYDILDQDFKYYDKVLSVCQKIAQIYGFERVETPILEQADLFSRGVGLGTDIVSKEMYAVKGVKTPLVMRPEGTASIVRSYIENGMNSSPKPVKLWYFGPFFRHEKPQAGRFRQFWQFGFEILGKKNPVVDAQSVQIFLTILNKLGLKNLIVHVNSIGCSKCRTKYIKALKLFTRSNQKDICADCKNRLKSNPLRVLDCKKEKCQDVFKQAPQILDSLCKKCRAHFKEVLELLDSLEVPYQLDPFLVRGLDYYTRTVFEVFHQSSDPDQKPIALLGGGRYDELVETLGGRPTPGCGAAAGIERIVSLMKQKGVSVPKKKKPDVLIAQLGSLAKRKALVLFEELRKANILPAEDFSRDSLKAQLAKANRLGIKYALILGQKEVIDNEVILRNMERKTQKTIKLTKVVQELKKKL